MGIDGTYASPSPKASSQAAAACRLREPCSYPSRTPTRRGLPARQGICGIWLQGARDSRRCYVALRRMELPARKIDESAVGAEHRRRDERPRSGHGFQHNRRCQGARRQLDHPANGLDVKIPYYTTIAGAFAVTKAIAAIALSSLKLAASRYRLDVCACRKAPGLRLMRNPLNMDQEVPV